MSTPSSSSKRNADEDGDGAADIDAAAGPPTKRATMSSWLNIAPPRAWTPSLIVSSEPVSDRQSTFIAFATSVTNPADATAFQSYVRTLVDAKTHPSKADHECLGWRCMVTKVGKSGLGGADDWVLKTGGEDDGEQRARATINGVLEDEVCIDVAVVVSRYYGGIMLGPKRFEIIANVTRSAVRRLATAIALPHLIARLKSLDQEIESNLVSISAATDGGDPKGKSRADTTTDYSVMKDEAKLERLVKAREKRLELLISLREKAQERYVDGEEVDGSEAQSGETSDNELIEGYASVTEGDIS